MKTVSFRFGKVTIHGPADHGPADQRTTHMLATAIAHGEGYDRITCTTVHVGACYVASSRVWWPDLTMAPAALP